MAKRIIIMLVCLLVLFSLFFVVKGYGKKAFMGKLAQEAPGAPVVSAMKATRQEWQPSINAVGSLRALKGVDVTSELAGIVRSVNFKSGDDVKQGQLLIELNADSDIALLNSLKATAELSQTVLKRDKEQFDVEAISRAQLDSDNADLKSKQAQVAQQQAIVDKKRLKAPFSGRVGITSVAPGQFVNPGDKLVTLQTLDPIFIDFSVPQQQISSLVIGQVISVDNDAYPGMQFPGKVNAISPKVDADTRNVQAEAVVHNTDRKLLPGMFGNLRVDSGGKKSYITVPQTAITYNPYGSSVFIAKPGDKKDPNGKDMMIASLVFVTTGPTRGDQVAILKGVEEGQMVVTTGQLKLKAGTLFTIDNSTVPANDQNPTPQER